MNSVDIASSVAGGALIGLSAALLLLADGRIAGISGIAGRLLDRPDGETPWRLAFLIGLLVGPLLYAFCADDGSHRRILAGAGGGLPSRGLRNADRIRMHQRARRVRSGTAVSAFARRRRRIHGRGDGDRRACTPWSIGMSNFRQIFASLVAGLLFGVGLAMSGMINPDRVLGFLDVFGHWNPALAFVLFGAVTVSAASYWIAGRRARP